MVRKSIPRFTKSPSLVLIRLVLTEIQAFKNVKNFTKKYNYLNGLKALSLVMLFAKQNEAESSHF